ncbi:MAG: nickel pincer cofactor biosynthesis protein LarC [Acidobacteria bacterium]|nr:MAG: nickel pincer cofactor biosynthesis protein LarC [Acidobacteriota bacterium]
MFPTTDHGPRTTDQGQRTLKTAYLDCSSGVSGDMFLGALLDSGLPAERLRAELRKIPLGDYEFKQSHVLRAGLAGTRVEIVVPEKQPERHLRDIEQLIEGSALTKTAKERAIEVFGRIAEAEGKLHDKPAAKVHFHEVGAVDAIIDVAGACAGLELLEVSELVSSPLNVGGGRVEAAHGSLPVPAPATAELLRDIPIYSSGVDAELVTPTGAALVVALARSFGPLPPMKVERIGYGAGARDLRGHPNLLRLFLGQRIELGSRESGVGAEAANSDAGEEIVSVLEANVDDMSPQLYGYLVERALAAGALDVTCSSIQMKKNRPGLEVSILCPPERSDALAQLLFDETTTIGLRIYEARRKVLDRELVTVETRYGAVRVKVARRDGRVLNVAPEYEDCQRLAAEKSVPLKEVILAAQLAYREQASK